MGRRSPGPLGTGGLSQERHGDESWKRDGPEVVQGPLGTGGLAQERHGEDMEEGWVGSRSDPRAPRIPPDVWAMESL